MAGSPICRPGTGMLKLADVARLSSMMANFASSGGAAKALVGQFKQLSQQIRPKWFAGGS